MTSLHHPPVRVLPTYSYQSYFNFQAQVFPIRQMLMSMMRKSKVKSLNLITDNTEIAVKTKTMNNEIVSLSSQSSLKEDYIGDAEDSLRLNKQAVQIMFYKDAIEQNKRELIGRFEQVSRENLELLERMRRERQAKDDACAEQLIKEQIRTQDQEFFHERISEMDSRVDDLRKTFQDKEYNYYVIAEKLSVFEELQEMFINCTSYSQSAVLADKVASRVVAKLSTEKMNLQQQIQAAKRQLLQLRNEDKQLRKAVAAGTNWEKFKYLIDRQDVVSQGAPDQFQRIQSQLHQIGIPLDKPEPSKSSIELLKILKREKTSSQLLNISFKDSTGVQAKLRKNHNRLIAKNKKLKAEFQYHLAQIHLLQMCMHKQLCPQSSSKTHLEVTFLQEIQQQNQKELDKVSRVAFDSNFSRKQKKGLLIRSGSEPDIRRIGQKITNKL